MDFIPTPTELAERAGIPDCLTPIFTLEKTFTDVEVAAMKILITELTEYADEATNELENNGHALSDKETGEVIDMRSDARNAIGTLELKLSCNQLLVDKNERTWEPERLIEGVVPVNELALQSMGVWMSGENGGGWECIRKPEEYVKVWAMARMLEESAEEMAKVLKAVRRGADSNEMNRICIESWAGDTAQYFAKNMDALYYLLKQKEQEEKPQME
jgi:hypothetical protein